MNSTRTTSRRTYHHGDLRNALVDAGAKLAEQGGPDAVGIRPAARLVGVTPTAAYRHFADADELCHAVKEKAFTVLTDAMRDRAANVGTASDADHAVERLRAIGRAYIQVALAEPGLFRVAFSEQGAVPFDRTVSRPDAATDQDTPGSPTSGSPMSGSSASYPSTPDDSAPAAVPRLAPDEAPTALGVLIQALDDLVDAGVVDPRRRPMAELAAWSAVHGFAHLALDGPLSRLPEEAVHAAAERVIDMVIDSLVGRPI